MHHTTASCTPSITGERWHFGALATRLAQAGLVVAVPSYTLYPRAVALAMAGEVAEALLWISAHADSFGGDAAAVSVLGHSAGAHLGALALLSLAQAHEESAAAAAQQGSNLERRHTASSSLARAPTRSSSSSSSTTTINDNNTCAPRHDDTTATALHAAGSPPPPLLPKLFVGMCGIYDVAAHRCHEAARGVAGVSTMSRAVGGAALFDAVSPTKLLRRAAQHAPRSSSGSSSTTAAAEGPRQQQRLPGAVAPHDTHHPMGAWLQAAQPLDAAPLLSRFAAGAPSGAAARLPPLLLMSSSGDHMVPPREAAAMAAAAAAAGARPHHLVYSRPRHNDFALDWVPLRSCCAAGATQSSNCGSNSGSDTGCGKLCSCRSASCSDTSRGQLLPWAVRLLLPRGGEQLPGFATDLLAMLTWQRGGKAAPAAGTSCSSCTGGLTPMLLGPQEGPAPFLPRARL
jgi:acetyl esterase/lipase